MNSLNMKLILAGVLSAHVIFCLGSPSPNSRTSGSSSGFGSIYTALSSLLSRPKSFSESLLPVEGDAGGGPVRRQDPPLEAEAPTFFDTMFSSQGKQQFQKRKQFSGKQQTKGKQQKFPHFQDFQPVPTPQYETISWNDVAPSKRSAQLDLPGYSYPTPENKLLLPGELDSSDTADGVEVLLPEEFRSSSSSGSSSPLVDMTADQLMNKLNGKLVFRKNGETLTGEDALEALNDFLDSGVSANSLSESASDRRFSVTSPRTVTASPINLSTTSGTIRLIQPIHIVSSSTARPADYDYDDGSDSFPFTHDRLVLSSPRPHTSSSSSNSRFPFNSIQSSRFSSSSSNNSQKKQQQVTRRPKQQPPALTFVDNGLVAVLGRQVAGKPVEGFPNGLPDLTPLGVRITLENMFGPNGDMVMNPIPGEAGVDYPVYNSVPDTGFNCGQQDFPGIYSDVEAQCQVFHMCQPNGESTAFLCPNGTMFNQQYFVCDWWYNIDCADQPSFYNLNQFIYETPEDDLK